MDNLFLLSLSSFKAEDSVTNGNRFFTGNGYMGVRGALSEMDKSSLAQLILSNMYDKREDKWREPISLPLPHFYQIKHFDKDLGINNPSLMSAHEQELDMQKAIFSRETKYYSNDCYITHKEERFVSGANHHLILSKITLLSDKSTEVEFNSFINTDVYDINGPHFDILQKSEDYVLIETLENKDRVAVCKKTSLSGKIELKENIAKEIVIISSIFSSKDNPDFEKLSKDSLKTDYEIEKANHIAFWANLWDNSQVAMEGDDDAQRGINNSLYHLHSIAPRYKDDLSIPARGLSGQTYKGAIFWDTEIFMLPFFLHTEPKVARSFLKYRINGLKGAREKAKQYGFLGAFYAWESQEEGFEGCTDFNVIDTFTKRPIRTYFRDKQIHISGDIAYAFDSYLEYTKDYSILEEGGLEVLYEIALFFYSRANLRADRTEVDYLDVLGPDEYHERVDNNAFTNKVARESFMVFYKYYQNAKTLGYSLPCSNEEANNLFEFSNLIKDAKKSELAENVISQFDEYPKLENVLVNDVRERLIHKNEYWGGATGVASNTQVIKQADVIAMIELYPQEFTKKEVEANWNYYNPRTEHGSSLSSCMYALSAIRIGKLEEAKELYYKSSLIDIIGGGKQFAGEIYIGGTHPASNGGSWMILAFGFCGLTINNGKISVKNNLPRGWKSVSFPLLYQGKKYKVYVSDTRADVKEIK